MVSLSCWDCLHRARQWGCGPSRKVRQAGVRGGARVCALPLNCTFHTCTYIYSYMVCMYVYPHALHHAFSRMYVCNVCACTQRVQVPCKMYHVFADGTHYRRNKCSSPCTQIIVSFHFLSLCPPLPTDNTYILHCVSNCSSVVQFLRVASHCSPTLLTPKGPQPQPTDSSSCRLEGQPPQTPGNTTGPPVNITSK